MNTMNVVFHNATCPLVPNLPREVCANFKTCCENWIETSLPAAPKRFSFCAAQKRKKKTPRRASKTMVFCVDAVRAQPYATSKPLLRLIPPPVLCRVAMLAMLTLFSGCSQLMGPKVPQEITKLSEPETAREYLFYKPLSYKSSQAWPLIIVCHGGLSGSAKTQIGHWAELAESRGFLVAAPNLKGQSSQKADKGDKNLLKLLDDEKHILGVVQHVRAGHTVSEDRIFIHGWSGGTAQALYVGLKHPEIFRSVSLASPSVEPGEIPIPGTAVDHYQPVMLAYQRSDMILGKKGKQLGDWLRTIGVALKDEVTGKVKPEDVQRFISFYEDVIRKTAWIRVTSAKSGSANPLELKFKAYATREPTAYRWEFGDGDTSPVAEPIHAYAKPGSYRVTLTLQGLPNGPHQRVVQVDVP